MLLSIIIPHYNLPKELLERCLQSITEQKIPNDDYEIIVVDDGSIEKPYWVNSNANTKLIPCEHSGPGGARNNGIEVANGEYIMFVDSDDYLLNNGELLTCIEKLRTERPQILRYKYIVSKEGVHTTTPSNRKIEFSNTISGALYMERNNLSGSSCTFFILRELITKKGIKFPTNIFHEDEEFNSIAHYHGLTLIDSDATIYCYCIRNGSTTANNSKAFEKKRIADFIQIIKRINSFAEANRANSNILQRRAISHKLDTLIVDAILNMMYSGMSAKSIRKMCKEHLAPISLYPLRKASYSLKYRIFRKFANNSLGMQILRIIIPKKKPAKK